MTSILSCPNCDAKELTHHLQIDKLNFSQNLRSGDIFKCISCDVHLLSPAPSESDINELYVETGVFSKEVKSAYQNKAFSSILERAYLRFGRDYEYIAKKSVEIAKLDRNSCILDVGCSIGVQMTAIQAKIPQCLVEGIDIDPGAKTNALPGMSDLIRIGHIDELAFDKKYDLIIFRFVIEHLPSCKKHIQIMRSLLKPGGVLVIATPDIGSAHARQQGENWNMISSDRFKIGHCAWYTKSALINLLRRHDFEVIEVRNRGSLLAEAPRAVQKFLIATLGRDKLQGRFISNYQLRMLWASFVDGAISEKISRGDMMYGFFRKPLAK